jgi:hypothetical protein
MKFRILIFLAALTSWCQLWGQDGSDILYRTVDKLDKSYIGDFVHLDFNNKSFHGAPTDTITIKIDSRSVRFIERRSDNGFNNWFNEQYLESMDKIEGQTVKIAKSRLKKITTDSVFVTDYLEFFENDRLLKSKEQENRFSKTIIAAVLVSAGSHKQQTK